MSISDDDTPIEDLSLTLLGRLRDGDSRAAEELERLYRNSLLRTARRYLSDPHAAEDAVQEVFAKILESNTAPENFRAWAYRITRNTCLNLLRSNNRRVDGELLITAFDAPSDQTGALTQLVRNEKNQNLGTLLARLSEAQREVIVLRYLEGLGREEIAEVLGLPVSVVKSRLFEGVKRLQDLAGS